MFGKKRSEKYEYTPTYEGDDNSQEKKGKVNGWVVTLNIFAMLVVTVALVHLTLALLQVYTRHNSSVVVPEVKGMTMEMAELKLKQANLKMEVVDSVFNQGVKPGTIIETTPAAGAIIKDRRTIYVVINNLTIKKVKVPDVYEISKRQAEAVLSRAGFTNINVVLVPGEFNNLAMCVKDMQGQTLLPGQELPFNTPINLEVTSKELMTDSLHMLNDSLQRLQQVPTVPSTTPDNSTDSDHDDNWF